MNTTSIENLAGYKIELEAIYTHRLKRGVKS